MAMQINKIKRKLAKNKNSEASIFDIHQVIEYGFPSSPSAVAFDPHLGLLALACGSGEIRVYGKPGVLLMGKHGKKVCVSQLVWIPNEGRLVSLSRCGQSNQSLITLFEINATKDKTTVIEVVKEISLESKHATKCAWIPLEKCLLIGTEEGDTLILDVASFTLQENAIHLDVAMQNVPDDFKINPGSVRDIAPHPVEPESVLIGFEKGLLILWNLQHKMAQGTFFVSCDTLQSVAWYEDGTQFITSHADGSYFTWSKDVEKQSDGPKQTFPFGQSDENMQALSNIKVCAPVADEADEETLVFSGGLPKLTYASVHSVSIKQGDKQVNYETASNIVDVVVIYENEIQEPVDEGTEGGREEVVEGEGDAPQAAESAPKAVPKSTASALAVLTDQELILIDLKQQTKQEDDLKVSPWPTFKKPYLNSASPNDVTCMYLYEDCTSAFVEKLSQFGAELFPDVSGRVWPVFGGTVDEGSADKSTVVVTGHYDGTIRFYDVGNGKFNLLYVVNLNNYFTPDDLDEESHNVEHEQLGDVKLRKIGEDFASCMDNNRFAICKLYVCPKSETLFVGSHSGQVIVFTFDSSESVEEIVCHEVKIVPDDVNFKWKGVHPAKPKDAQLETFPPGYTLGFVVQCEPPAPVTAMIASNKYGLLAVGTSHGFAVFDCVKKAAVLSRSTLVENDEAASGAKLSKSKSLKEGIRNSFRRLKPKKAADPMPAESAHKDPPKDAPKVESAPAEEPNTAEEKQGEHEKEKETEDANVASGSGSEPVAASDAPADVENQDGKPEDAAATGEEETTGAKVDEDVAKTDEEKLKDQEAENAASPPAAEEAPTTSAPHVTIVEPTGSGRVVEARGESQDKTMMSTVRCMFFADTFLKNGKENSPSLWIGTHAGSVYSYLVNLPEDRESGEAKLRLAKEIKLLHRAPVVYMNVLDHSGFPLPDSAAVAAEKASGADMSGHHHLLVCSEEQMKLFTLPTLKPKYKEKLTAVHGVKIRKVAPIKTRADGVTSNFLACMCNDGSVCTFSLPALFRQYNQDLVNADNKIASSYTEFDNEGNAYVLEQTNLITHYSLFKKCATNKFHVDLPEGSRPVPVPVAVPVDAEPAVPETEAAEPEEVVDEQVEADKVENVESAPAGALGTDEAADAAQEDEEEAPQDLPTVEEEAKKMIDEAEELKDAEFQKMLQEQLTHENPELTVTTVTTYKAIESRTIISADDGTQCSKIITTTRDTTLALDGDIVTQKTQQKEEFEVSPSEEQDPSEFDNANLGRSGEEQPEETREKEEATVVIESVSVVECQQTPEGLEESTKSGNVTSDDEEVQHADSLKVEVEATPVRTATLTHNDDADQITHHIGNAEEDHEQDQADEKPEEKEAEKGGDGDEQEADESKKPEDEDVEKPEGEGESDDVKGECYGGSNGNLYSPLSVEESAADQEEKNNEDTSPIDKDEPAEDELKGECYGGSQGKLYSPMGREENGDHTAQSDIIDNEEGELENGSQDQHMNGDVVENEGDCQEDQPPQLLNGVEGGDVAATESESDNPLQKTVSDLNASAAETIDNGLESNGQEMES